MSLVRWQATITDESGNVQSGASVEIRNQAGALVSVWTDEAGTISAGNPFLSNASGYAFGYVLGGSYDITATKGAVSITWEDVRLSPFSDGTDLRYSPTFATVAAMTAATPLALDGSAVVFVAGMEARTQGEASAGDGGYGTWLIVAGNSASSNHRKLLGNGMTAVFKSGVLLSGTTIGIPSDYATLQLALDDTVGWEVGADQVIDLFIETGHTLTNGLEIINRDCRNFTISSADATVFLAAGFVGVTVESTQPNALIAGSGSVMPKLNCLIQADDKCSAGYLCYGNSVGSVAPSCGVTYAGSWALYVLNSSQCEAQAANFSFAGLGSRVTTSSRLEAQDANFSNTQDRGWPDTNLDRCGLDVSRGSMVNIKSQTGLTDLSNSFGNGLSVRRSWASADGIDVSGAGRTGIRAENNAHVNAPVAIMDTCLSYGALVTSGATLQIEGANLNNCVDYGVNATGGSRVMAKGATATGITGVGRAFYAADGSTIDAAETTASNAAGVGYYAIYGSSINARSCVVDLATSYGALADYGSTINVSGGTLSNSVAGQDIRCTRGSTISASGSTGIVSKTVNVLDVNGVIYR